MEFMKYIAYPVRIEETGEIRLVYSKFDYKDREIEDKILDMIFDRFDKYGDYTVLEYFMSDAPTPEDIVIDYFRREVVEHVKNIFMISDFDITLPENDPRTVLFDFNSKLYTVTLKRFVFEWVDGIIKSYSYELSSVDKGVQSYFMQEDDLFTEFNFDIINDIVLDDLSVDIPEFEDGGELKPAKFSKVVGSSSRFKPYSETVFEPPIIGRNGNQLTSYLWSYEWDERPNWEGELVPYRKSDWSNAELSDETGRQIVHKFYIRKADGEIITASSESVPVLLGYLDKKQMKSFPNLVTALKTLAKQKLQLSIIEEENRKLDEAKALVDKMPKPEIERGDDEHIGRITWKMGDAWCLQESEEFNYENRQMEPVLEISEERKECVYSSWMRNRLKELGFDRTYAASTYDLKKRIERQEKKIAELSKMQNAESQFEDGGAVIPETIMVDGVERPTRNNLGKLIHETIAGIENFWRWFGDSKMIDAQLRPIVVYHGTNSDFHQFSASEIGSANDRGFYGRGFYFTFNSDPSWQSAARGEAGYYGNRIISAYVKTDNPFDMSSLSEYNGIRTFSMYHEPVVFLKNIADKFPEISNEIVLEKRGKYNRVDNSYEISYVGISVLPELFKKYDEDVIIETAYDGGKPSILFAYAKSKTKKASFTDSEGKIHEWDDTDDFGRWHVSLPENEAKLYAIIEAIEKYEGIKANYHAEGYMTRYESITDAIKNKGHDAIVQSLDGDEIVVFLPSQIKSATENNGDFDPNNPDIRFEDGGGVDGGREKIGEVVKQRLIKSQESKEFKDTEIVKYTKKYKVNYNLVSSQNLDEVEEDSVIAYKMVEKSRVWQEYVPADEKEKGYSSGATYLKVKCRDAMAARPFDSADARKVYVNGIEKLIEVLNNCYSYEQTDDALRGFLDRKDLFVGDLSEQEKKRSWSSDDWRRAEKLKGIFGVRFENFCKNRSDSAALDRKKAVGYSAFTKEEQDAWIDTRVASLNNYIDRASKVISDINKLNSYDELKNRDKDLYYKLSPYIKGSFDKFKQEVVSVFSNSITSSTSSITEIKDGSNIPEKYKIRMDDWSWTDEQKAERKGGDKDANAPKINTKIPLAYIKRTGGIKSPEVSVENIRKYFGFKNVIFGKALNDEFSRAHVRHFLGALTDLSEILNIDMAKVNSLGGLDINFATMGVGGHMATYFPSVKAINLSKNRGDGSVAHEWFHYFDNMVAEKDQHGGTYSFITSVFTSYNESAGVSNSAKALMDYINKGDGGFFKKVRYYAQSDIKYQGVYADTAEKAIEVAQKEYSGYRNGSMADGKSTVNFFGYIAYKFGLEYIDVDMHYNSSKYYYDSNHVAKSEYWVRSQELAARAFEAYIQLKLEKAGRVNNYLVSYKDNWAKWGDKMPYPQGAELEKISVLFDALFESVKNSMSIGDFVAFSKERQDEYIDFKDDDKTEVVEAAVVVESEVEPVVKDDVVNIVDDKQTAPALNENIETVVTEKSETMSDDDINKKVELQRSYIEKMMNPDNTDVYVREFIIQGFGISPVLIKDYGYKVDDYLVTERGLFKFAGFKKTNRRIWHDKFKQQIAESLNNEIRKEEQHLVRTKKQIEFWENIPVVKIENVKVGDTFVLLQIDSENLKVVGNVRFNITNVYDQWADGRVLSIDGTVLDYDDISSGDLVKEVIRTTAYGFVEESDNKDDIKEEKKVAENNKLEKSNLKTVKIIIPNDAVLKRVNSTPALKKLSRLDLVVGDNIEKVNHFQFSEMQRLYPVLNIELIELDKKNQIPMTGKYTLAKHKDIVKRTYDGEITIDEFKAAFYSALESQSELTAELEPLKKDALLKLLGGMMAYRYKSEKKEAAIRAIVTDVVDFFALGSYTMNFGDDPFKGVKDKVESLTQKSLDDYAAKIKESRAKRIADVEKAKLAIENPVTLEDFQTLIRVKGKEGMTPEQSAAYDELIAQQTKEKQQREEESKAVVKQVELEGVEMNIYETKHTKKGTPLFVVKLSERVDKDVYTELNKRAKQLGGYYSSYAREGAIAGFQFTEREQAEKFIAVKHGDVSNVEKVQEKKEEKKEKRADKLRQNAESIIERVDNELSKDRVTNTARRASMASNTESKLNTEKSIAKTMINIADAIESGETKYLDNVRTKAQIEQLNEIVTNAFYKFRMGKYKSYPEQEQHKYDPITPEAIDYVDEHYLFYPKVYVERWMDAVNKNEDKSGLKNIAGKIKKYLKGSGEYYKIKNKQELDDFMEFAEKVPDSWETSRLKEFAKSHKRLVSLGVESDEMLRALLREFVQYRGGVEKISRVKQLERELAGKKVGFDFFPTPKSGAEKMVDMADVKAGMSFLEPSAGNGNIADAIRDKTGIMADVCEISGELAEILKEKGYNLVASDFLDYNEKKYDRIIMNPPFSNRMDAEHLKHAYELLKPNGKVVSIVGEGIFSGSDRKAVEFREWIDSLGAYVEKLPEGTFTDKSLYATTGANARLVVIDKEGVRETDDEPETITETETSADENVNGIFITYDDGTPASEFLGLSENEAKELFEKYKQDENIKFLIWKKINPETGRYDDVVSALQLKEDESVIDYLKLPTPTNTSDVKDGIVKIVSMYSGREMAYIQVYHYLGQIGELGKQYVKEKRIETPEQLRKHTEYLQSKARKDVIDEGKKESAEAEKNISAMKAQTAVDNITKMAIEQGENMQREIDRQYPQKFSIPDEIKHLYKIVGDFSDIRGWRGEILNEWPENYKEYFSPQHIEGKTESEVRDMESKIGYVMISTESNHIIPITRFDEHQQGYEALEYIVYDKYHVKQEDYVSVWIIGNNYIYSEKEIPSFLIAAKKYIEYGGDKNNLIYIAGDGTIGKYVITIGEFVERDGDYKIVLTDKENNVSYLGKRFINKLTELSDLFSEYHLNPMKQGNQKFIETIWNSTDRFLEELSELKRTMDYNGGLLKQINNAGFTDFFFKHKDSVITDDILMDLERKLFSFAGVKNVIHRGLKQGSEELKRYFFNLELALEMFNQIDVPDRSKRKDVSEIKKETKTGASSEEKALLELMNSERERQEQELELLELEMEMGD